MYVQRENILKKYGNIYDLSSQKIFKNLSIIIHKIRKLMKDKKSHKSTTITIWFFDWRLFFVFLFFLFPFFEISSLVGRSEHTHLLGRRTNIVFNLLLFAQENKLFWSIGNFLRLRRVIDIGFWKPYILLTLRRNPNRDQLALAFPGIRRSTHRAFQVVLTVLQPQRRFWLRT